MCAINVMKNFARCKNCFVFLTSVRKSAVNCFANRKTDMNFLTPMQNCFNKFFYTFVPYLFVPIS